MSFLLYLSHRSSSDDADADVDAVDDDDHRMPCINTRVVDISADDDIDVADDG
jgi:hypothetical protein